jgi:DNA ligase-1
LTLLAELVATSDAVAATSARSAKIDLLAGFLGGLGPGEVETATAFLTGEPRQGKIGVGWATISKLQPEPAGEASLQLTDLDAALTAVQQATGPGSAARRSTLLADVLGRATAAEAGFVGRLLVGELRQGALQGVMAEAIARAAGAPSRAVRRAVMLAGDLPRVAGLAVTGGVEALAGVGMVVLHPVLPMLAATAPSVDEAVAACGLSSVEWKLDGIRIQLHRRGDEVRVFTRNLNDVTDRLSSVCEVARSLRCRQVILDGEAVGDTALFFDCLHVDGDDLIDLPLRERLETLDHVAGRWRIPGTITADPDEGASVLDASLDAGHEGVMVKAIDSTYEAGRRGKSWRKVKPVHTLDLVVLAAEWGYGRRRGWLSNIHLGALGPEGGFLMVGKTFKGMTDQLLTWQTEQFLAREVVRRGIVVEVRPELVVEIAVDGVHVSTRYPGGVALRFSRVRKYRPDKAPEEADTIDAVRALLPLRT